MTWPIRSRPIPVLRESTRVTAAAVVAGQTSIDPKVIEKWVGPNVLKHRMIWMAVGEKSMADALKNYDKHHALYVEFSPYNHLDGGDPPLFMTYGNDMTLPSKDAGHGIHHPVFGLKMKAKADEVGQECYLLIPGVSKPGKYRNADAFLTAKLLLALVHRPTVIGSLIREFRGEKASVVHAISKWSYHESEFPPSGAVPRHKPSVKTKPSSRHLSARSTDARRDDSIADGDQSFGAGVADRLSSCDLEIEHVVGFPRRVVIDVELGDFGVFIRVVVEVFQSVRTAVPPFFSVGELGEGHDVMAGRGRRPLRGSC